MSLNQQKNWEQEMEHYSIKNAKPVPSAALNASSISRNKNELLYTWFNSLFERMDKNNL